MGIGAYFVKRTTPSTFGTFDISICPTMVDIFVFDQVVVDLYVDVELVLERTTTATETSDIILSLFVRCCSMCI